MEVFGQTRSKITSRYAFITPDTWVWSGLPGWEGSRCVVHISPHMMNARFMQATIEMPNRSLAGKPRPGVQRFVYVKTGALNVTVDGTSHNLSEGHFAYLPADQLHSIMVTKETQLLLIEKPYLHLDGIPSPKAVIGNSDSIASSAFMGDEDAQLKLLLPTTINMDMAVNIFTYQSGAALPQVEVHVMEHGLQMISGAGVYRLDDDWFPTKQGDIIWMASYCPQWFVAMGKQPAAYIYYKDVNRDPLHV